MYPPVCCFSCGRVFGSKWYRYQAIIREPHTAPLTCDQWARVAAKPEVFQGFVLTSLGLTRLCCRARILTHVEKSDTLTDLDGWMLLACRKCDKMVLKREMREQVCAACQ